MWVALGVCVRTSTRSTVHCARTFPITQMALFYATLPFSVFKDDFRLADVITRLHLPPTLVQSAPPPTQGLRTRDGRISRDATPFTPACTCNNHNHDGQGRLTRSQRRSLCNAQVHRVATNDAPVATAVTNPGGIVRPVMARKRRQGWWRKRATAKVPASVPPEARIGSS